MYLIYVYKQAVIFGPDDTPWEGGTFKLLLEFSEDYPNKPPSVRFITRMYVLGTLNTISGFLSWERVFGDVRRQEKEGGGRAGE